MARKRILTIYNCGTSSNRDKATALKPGKGGELIADLHERTAGGDINDYARLDLAAYSYKLIHDGPGSGPAEFGTWERNDGGVRQFVKHPASASQATRPGVKPGSIPGVTKVKSMGQTALGVATGFGWQDNAAHAIRIVESFAPGKRPEAINMAGWSRGGVTCHMIAHALHEHQDPEIRGIDVSIFAVDPVAGGPAALHGIAHGKERLTIPPNVKSYCGVFAAHDFKTGFTPVVVKGGAGKCEFLLMPGVHDTLVQGGPGLHAVAVLVDYLAARFLAARGTAFQRRLHLRPEEILENYAIARRTTSGAGGKQLPKGQETYEGLARKGATNIALGVVAGLGGLLGARKGLTGGVQGGDAARAYFVNDHHRRVFERTYPGVYRLAFGRDKHQALKPHETQFNSELAVLKSVCRNSWAQLAAVIGS